MHGSPDAAATFLEVMIARFGDDPSREVVVCPPFTALPAAAMIASGSAIAVGGQNCHWEDKGAFTGEVAASMLVELGAPLGHRRPLRATAVLRRDGRHSGRPRPCRAARRAIGHLLPGRDPRAARGRRNARRTGAAERRRWPASTPEPRGRLRAGLGDRHRAHRHGGPGPGGARVPARPDRRSPRRRRRGGLAHPLRRQRQGRQRGRVAGPGGRRRGARRRRQP